MYHRGAGQQHRRTLIKHLIEISYMGFDFSMIMSFGKRHEELSFWSTHSGAEVDLFWQEHGKNWAMEIKYADAPRFTPSMASAMKDLDLAHLWILYPGDRAYPLAPGVSTLPLTHIGDSWRYE